ncbi:ABC transporter ATP-binding protein [Frondihabitans cladoniiphilus]|uniref:ABC transporter ATP-binding protein n=1 Tax=Frondihabitans cladoniiphilus TaxID=715785 RepID=A0ABP8VT17_9MICO
MSPADTADFAIQTKALTKSFGKQLAVNDVDLAVPRGSVFGFLGPNGSGKTSTIRMLLGLTQATSGEVRMLGGAMPDRAHSILPRVGALVEGPSFYPFLTGRANLRRLDTADRYASGATRDARVDAALDRVGLTHAATKKAHAYSLGMKQRLGIANALLMPRDLLILDEPSNGLDPQGTREVRQLISSLADEGTTIFVSSHLLSEIEQMCTHVAVMSAGRLLTQGTLDELRAQGVQRVTVLTPDPDDAVRVLGGLGLHPTLAPGHDDEASHPATVTAEVPLDGLLPERITAALVEGGVRVRGIQVAGASLEDRFVDLTGEGFDVAG